MDVLKIKKKFYFYCSALWWAIALIGFINAIFYSKHSNGVIEFRSALDLSFYYWVPALVWTFITPLIVALYKKHPIRKGKLSSIAKHSLIMLLLIPFVRLLSLYIDFSLKEVIGFIDVSATEVLGSVLWVIPASSTKGIVCYSLIIGSHYYFDIKLNPGNSKLGSIPTVQNNHDSNTSTDSFSAKTTICEKVQDSKLFLNPELSIEDLSKEVGYSTRTISKVINGEMNKNFFQFINEYRVEEMKKRLTDSNWSHLTIHGIGLDSGFNSKATANRIFKMHTGLTPSQYKRLNFSNDDPKSLD